MLAAGTRVGPYDIQSALGSGGMGEVYRARDARLGRDVAIKILPAAFHTDPVRLARFEREARVLASLNHPHIAAIYGVEEAAGAHALVLEFVEGETLTDRIVRGMTVREAIDVARQVVEALDAAHETGIIHRDLKPGNIMITRDGVVKVLDFGLAKPAGSSPAQEPTHSPTFTAAATVGGMLLGTVAYMSPEQARGLAVDKRTDIWAFGCVLYELVTGRSAFLRATTSDTLAAILEHEPDWTALPDDTRVLRVLKRCLQKDPKTRLRDIADARADLEEPPNVRSDQREPGLPSSRHVKAGTIVKGVAAIVAAGVAGWFGNQWLGLPRTAVIDAAEMRLQIPTPPTTDPASLAISPDGSRIVFVATSEGRPLLWLRSLDDIAPRVLPGTAGAEFPFWSPDGESVGFFADRQLKRLDLSRGTVRVLAPTEGGRGGAWSQEGVIVFQPTPGQSALQKVAADGGEPADLPTGAGRFPQFLPDGRHFVFSRTYGAADAETRGLYIGGLDGGLPKLLVELADSAGVVTASNHVLFVYQGTLFAQSIDPVTLEAKGGPSPVAAGLTVNPPLWLSPIAASRGGPILYRTGSAGGVRQFVWFDRSGRELSKVGDPIPGMLSPTLSPDGLRLAVHRSVDGNSDIWFIETGRGLLTRFTSGAGSEFFPLWAPDGRSLVFNSGGWGLVRKSVTGGEAETRFLQTGDGATTDWSADGRFLLYTSSDGAGRRDLWAVNVEGDRKPFAVSNTAFNERDGVLSIDGKWVAYTSDASGRDEVYVQRFPDAGERMQVSTAGGGMARWRRDGQELFYIALDGRLMSVPMREKPGHGALEAGTATALFQTRVGAPVQPNSRQQYMVAPDGQRFLMNTLVEENAAPITVILNWKAPR